MTLIRLPRFPVFYTISAACIVILHAVWCHPAAVTRSFVKPEDIIALFLVPLAMVFPPFFDDAENDPDARLRRSAWVTAGFCFVWGIVATNLNDARPHIGHSAGVVGILLSRHIFVIGNALVYFVPAMPFFYCLDGIGIGLWSLVRRFDDTIPLPPIEQDRSSRTA